MWIVVGFGLLGPAALLPLGGPLGATGAASATFRCRIVFGSTPAALLIPAAAPNGSLAAGDHLGFAYEYRVDNYSAALAGRSLHVPATFAIFPRSGGGNVQIYLAPHVLPISGSNWTNGTGTSASAALPASVTFAKGGTANRSMMKLAVMADAGFGQVELSVRWRWTVQPSNGSLGVGPWTVPNATAFHPSLLYPAPFVSLLGRSATTAVLGSNVTATLGGAISREPFFLELEHPSGHVVNSIGETAPAGNATPYTVAIRLESRDIDLPPGPMLLHIHNHCGSMLYSLPVTGQFPGQATVTVATNLPLCASIVFNGTTASSGTAVNATPSTASVPIRAPSCPGFTFQGWNVTGGLDVANPTYARTNLLVSYDGSLTARYG